VVFPRRGHPLNAAADDQLRLLDLAEQDARLAQLDHRRRSLPEIAQIEELSAEQGGLRDRIVAAETEASDVAREVTKAETDVEQVRARAGRDQERLDSGAITSAKELESLQHEIGSLAKRQADLEDIELEILERLEDVQRVLTELGQRSADLESELESAIQRRDAAFTEIDTDTEIVTEGRASLASSTPADLLALYEKVRAKNGVGAAALSRGRCGGCRMELNSTELGAARQAAPDAVLRHEDCGVILVRTAESGL
jgi:predicted  nucleic acid-binding Zn-ribbon protein